MNPCAIPDSPFGPADVSDRAQVAPTEPAENPVEPAIQEPSAELSLR